MTIGPADNVFWRSGLALTVALAIAATKTDPDARSPAAKPARLPTARPAPVPAPTITLPRATLIRWEPSPAGHKAAIQLWDVPGRFPVLCIADLSPTGPRPPLAIDWAFVCGWSPDGKLLVYQQLTRHVYPSGSRGSGLSVFSAASGATRTLTTGYVDRVATWRSDGRGLIFLRWDLLRPRSDTARFMMLDRSGSVFGKPRPTGHVLDKTSQVRWRPGKYEFAYARTTRARQLRWRPRPRLTASWHSDLYLTNVRTGQTTRLTRSGLVWRFGFGWSPDGRHIAYGTYAAGPAYADKLHAVEVLDLATGKVRVVLGPSRLARAPIEQLDTLDWSPDGKRILLGAWVSTSSVNSGLNRGNIAVIDWPSGRFRWLTTDGKSTMPRWSPKGGREIWFVRGRRELWAMSATGQSQRKLLTLRFKPAQKRPGRP